MLSDTARTLTRRLAPVLAAGLLAGACNGDGGQESGAPEESADTVALVGRDDLTWDSEQLFADAGTVTVQLTCQDAVNHNVVIDGTEVAACAPGESVEGQIELSTGDHDYVCTVPGHESTMQGTITVS